MVTLCLRKYNMHRILELVIEFVRLSQVCTNIFIFIILKILKGLQLIFQECEGFILTFVFLRSVFNLLPAPPQKHPEK